MTKQHPRASSTPHRRVVHRIQLRRLFQMSLVGLLAACGASPKAGSRALSSSPPSGSGSSGSGNATAIPGTSLTRDKTIIPPQAYYDSLILDRVNTAASSTNLASSQSSPQVVWLNFGGGAVTKGDGRGQSFLLCQGQAAIPASSITPSDQEAIANRVAEFYSNAGVALDITLTQPSSGDYTAVYIGGNYQTLGCNDASVNDGIAPFDPSNANPNDVAFVFYNNQSNEVIAENIAHQSGHTFGLDNSNNPNDLMSLMQSTTAVSFGDGTAITSGQDQNSVTILQANLGSGVATVDGATIQPTHPTSLNLASASPSAQSPLPGLSTIVGLNSMMSSLPSSAITAITPAIPTIIAVGALAGVSLPYVSTALAVMSIAQSVAKAQNGGQPSPQQISSLINGFQPSGMTQLLTSIGLSALMTPSNSGSASPATILSRLLPLVIPGFTNATGSASTSTSPSSVVLPSSANPANLAQLLGIANISNPASLIALIPQYSASIAAVAQGQNYQALMSLVGMAIGQQYQSIVGSTGS